MNWECLFKPHILERGLTYYREGRVAWLEADADEITAVVEGSDSYDVSIELERGEIRGMKCTCPYAEEGRECKHMAAVLYAWEDEKNAPRNDDAQIWEAVERAPDALVRRFLKDALLRDRKLLRHFMIQARQDDAPSYLNDIEETVDEIVNRYMAEGFIDYAQADKFVFELSAILDGEAVLCMECGRNREAFIISTFVFLALDDIDMDDSEGGIAEIAIACQSIWERIAEQADADLRRVMFDWLLDYSNGAIMDILRDYCKEALIQCCDAPDYMERLFESEQAALDRALQKGNMGFIVEQSARNCLRLMEKRGDSEDAQDAWCMQYRSVPCVRNAMIERRRQAGKWAEVVSLLQEAIDSNDGRFGSQAAYYIRLKDAYAALGRKDEYRRTLWKIATEIRPANIDIYHEYRALFESAQWQAERERLLAALPQHADIAALYADEGLYDRLLKCALAAHGTYLLQRYEKVLAERFPEQVLKKYADSLSAEAQYTANRSVYQGWVAQLRHIREMPGGKAVVDAIVQTWRREYPRRKAMLEELNRL